MYNEKYAKTKIRSYESRINTNFHDNEMSKEGFHCISLSVILILFLKWVKTIIHRNFWKFLLIILIKKLLTKRSMYKLDFKDFVNTVINSRLTVN